MSATRLFSLAAALTLLPAALGAQPLLAPVPQAINHEGFLLDDDGLPVSRDVILTLSIYDAPDAPAPLWFEEVQVSVIGGYYSVPLGAAQGLGWVAPGEDRYLGVALDHGDELTPRHPILSVPYAVMAENAVGDITPRTVSVGGREVIDAEGNWVGLGDDPNGGGGGEITAAELLVELRTVDGPGSLLDADLLDGLDSTEFVLADDLLSELRQVDGPGSLIDADSLDGIDSSLFVSTSGRLLELLLAADGHGTGVDADTVDGLHADRFLRTDRDGATSGSLGAARFDVNPHEIGGGARPWMTHGLRVGGGGSDNAYFGLKVEGGNRADAVLAWGDDADESLRFLYAGSGGDPNGAEHMRIESSGNVGVGVADPSVRLDVGGAVRGTELTAPRLHLTAPGALPAACAAVEEGGVRYNRDRKLLEFCNGSEWVGFGDPCAGQMFATCLELRDSGCSRGDGEYVIDPDGAGGEPPSTIYCDMSVGGGGFGFVVHEDLIAYWSFDGDNPTVADYGNYAGVLQGGASVSEVVPGLGFGQSLLFANDDSGRMDVVPNVMLPATSTVVFWARHNQCVNNQIPVLLSDDNSWMGDLIYGSSWRIRNTYRYQTNAVNICQATVNTWAHHAYVDDGAALRVYRNGELQEAQVYSYDTVAGLGLDHFGNRPGFGTNGLGGNLDDLAVFGRALTVQEIQRLYQSGTAGTPLRWRELPSVSRYGSGQDGTLEVAGTFNLNLHASGARARPDGVAYQVAANPGGSTITTTHAAVGIESGDRILLINLRGTAANHNDVGAWEVLQVTGRDGATLSVAEPVARSYSSGNFGSQSVVVQRIPQYSAVRVFAGGVLTTGGWDRLGDHGDGRRTTGVVALLASESVFVEGWGNVDASERGFWGGPSLRWSGHNAPGESYTGTGPDGTAAYYGGGGAGWHWPGHHSGAGGGGGYGGAGEKGRSDQPAAGGEPGNTYGTASLDRLYLGSGGGGGSENCDGCTSHGQGGNGGGIVFIGTEQLTSQGVIWANGEVGHHELNHSSKDGGGSGSGGSLYLDVGTADLGDGLVTANGAPRCAGSGAGYPNSPGGAGGAGRVAVYFNDSVAGSTQPAAHTEQLQ